MPLAQSATFLPGPPTNQHQHPVSRRKNKEREKGAKNDYTHLLNVSRAAIRAYLGKVRTRKSEICKFQQCECFTLIASA